MKYKDNLDQVINLKEYKYLDEGATARVYTKDDKAVKIYKETALEDWKINEEIFNILKSINNPHLLTLKSKINKKYDKKKKDYTKKYLLYGYTYDFIDHIDDNLFEIPFELLIQNIHEIDMLIKELTKAYIRIGDTKGAHLLFDGTNLTIIDPDFFVFDYMKDLLEYNRMEMLDYYRSKFVYFLGKRRGSFDLVEDTFRCDLKQDEIIHEIKPKLKHLVNDVYKQL